MLINNAAAYVDWTETATGADLQAARGVLETNLFGAWRLTQALLPLLGQSPSVNSVCPGLTATWPGVEDMGAGPVTDSATGVAWAATHCLPAAPPAVSSATSSHCPGSRSRSAACLATARWARACASR